MASLGSSRISSSNTSNTRARQTLGDDELNRQAAVNLLSNNAQPTQQVGMGSFARTNPQSAQMGTRIGLPSGGTTRQPMPSQGSVNTQQTSTAARTAIGNTGLGTGVRNRGLGGQGTGGAPAGPADPADPTPPSIDDQQKDILGASYVTPTTVDTTAADAAYDKALEDYKSTWAQTQSMSSRANALANNRAAATASLQGLAPGGSAYMSTLRQGNLNGINAINDQNARWQQGLANMEYGHSGQLYGVAGQNAGIEANRKRTNAGRTGDLMDAAASADQATQEGQTKAYLTNVQGQLAQYGIHIAAYGEPNQGATNGIAQSLVQAYNSAPDEAAKAAAQAALDKYLNLLGQATAYYKDPKYNLNGTFKSLEDYLKAVEDLGYFTTGNTTNLYDVALQDSQYAEWNS